MQKQYNWTRRITAVRPIPAYTAAARWLHWATAALIFLTIPLGVLIANEAGGSAQDFLYDLHRSLGATLIPIIILRLIWRFVYPPPPLPNDIPAMQRLAATTTHRALYVLLLVQPFVGWAATSAYPATITVWGLLDLPPLWPASRLASDRLFSIHQAIGVAIACLVIAHVTAALYHHFVRKDRVLMRMIAGR
jgi:cytochrome b561